MTASVLGALGGIITTRYISPELAGQFRLFTIPLMYLAILHIGTHDGLFRLVPFHRGRQEYEAIKEISEAASTWSKLVSLTISLLFLVAAIHGLLVEDYFAFWGWVAQIPITWALFYGGYLSTMYRTNNEFGKLSAIQLVQSILQFGLVFFLPKLQFVGLCAKAAVPSLISVFLQHKHQRRALTSTFNKSALFRLSRAGMPFFTWNYISGPLWIATESVLILKYFGVKELGYFTVALVVREAMQTLPQSIQQVIVPRVVEQYARGGTDRSQFLQLAQMSLITAIVVMLLILPAKLAIDSFIPIFSPMYVDAIPAITLSMFFALPQAFLTPLNILFASGRHWSYGMSVLVGFAGFGIAILVLPVWLDGAIMILTASLFGRILSLLPVYWGIGNIPRKQKDDYGS